MGRVVLSPATDTGESRSLARASL